MNLKIAVKKLLPMIRNGKWYHATEDYDKNHILFMCNEIYLGKVTGEQAHRWLGYIQGVLVAVGITTVEQMKQLNKSS